jgi:hypothetical protein
MFRILAAVRRRALPGLVVLTLPFLAAAAVAAPELTVAPGGWFTDAFPANETFGLAGVAQLFDTCAAHVRTGVNLAQRTGDASRFIIPGDSLVATVTGTGGEPDRVDLVFRIFPGPGNYVTRGVPTSGLRRVPTAATAATAGDGSFWGQYLADRGPFGSASGHVGDTWNPDVWNSARCDTAERNLLPVDGLAPGLSGLTAGTWMSTYHEADPKFATLGILRNRCFLVDTLGTVTSANITCDAVPTWLQDDDLAARAGYDGDAQTREGTRIIPDGLLTPGSHVEYFLRRSPLASPDDFVMNPDTNYISPQPALDLDGHRWQEFSVLPDRWKAAEYGGLGDACVLVVSYDDGGGTERAFVGIADTLGLTVAAHYGAHDGWYCSSAYVAPDGSHDYAGRNVGSLGQYDACPVMGKGKITIWKHGGCAGSLFDLYRVSVPAAAEDGANGLGARRASRTGMGLAAGKWGQQAPTSEMLRTYYRMIILLSGNRSSAILGPGPDCGSDDVATLEDFLEYAADVEQPRGLWVMGNGFAESEWESGEQHWPLLTDYMGAYLWHHSYCEAAADPSPLVDLTMAPTFLPSLDPLSLRNGTGQSCTSPGNDVLDLTGVPGTMAASWYGPHAGSYIAGVYGPSVEGHPYVTLLDGFDLKDVLCPYYYVWSVLNDAFSSVCGLFIGPLVLSGSAGCGSTGGVPAESAPSADHLGATWGNPLSPGRQAMVRFGLARADRVTVKVYDMAGRPVRTLAEERQFPAGEHSLVWDGRGDDGRTLRAGVYFTQVRCSASGFVGARKLTLLR